MKRVKYLVKAAKAYKFELPENYENMFENRPEPQLSSMDKLRLSISDYMLDGIVDEFIPKAKYIISKTNIPTASDIECERICERFDFVVPASKCKSLTDILNSAWHAYHNPELWKNIPDIAKNKNQILKDLVLKNIEIFEVEEILKKSRK